MIKWYLKWRAKRRAKAAHESIVSLVDMYASITEAYLDTGKPVSLQHHIQDLYIMTVAMEKKFKASMDEAGVKEAKCLDLTFWLGNE